jgi:predicted nucleic acid-binding protein
VILADTSVWVDQLRWPNARLIAALEEGQVATHPFIIGELACGNLRNRRALLDLWGDLPIVPTATDAEALLFIERHRLMGLGLGYVDVHLLASAALAGDARVWTKDKPLNAAAARLDLQYDDSR